MGFVEQLCKAKAARRTTWGLRWGSSGGCDPRSHWPGPGGGPPESDAGGGQPGVSRRVGVTQQWAPAGPPAALLGLPGSRARPTRSGAFKPGRLGMPMDRGPDGQTRPLTRNSPPRRGRKRGPAVEPDRLGVPVGCQWHSLNHRVEGGRLGVRRSSPADSEWSHVVVEPGPGRLGVE